MKRCDFRGQTFTQRELIDALPRAEVSVDDAAHIVEPMLAGVRERGAAYLRELSEKFDSVRPHHLRVPANALTSALKTLDPMVRAGLEEAITRVRAVHKAQRPHDFTVEVAAGASVRQRWIPVARVGLYVPGGLAVYPSSVIMNVVAAQEAGVQSLAVASPPQARHGGLPHPTILAACELLGVSEVYAVGGAGAIGMFAYGAAGSEPQDGEWLCEPVNVITGPGNVFVAAAKRLVRGHVGIDAEAGPTEIAILADDTASVEHVVADLISQAEHDPQAGSVLVTMSESLADQVAQSIGDVAGRTKHAERVVEALSGPQSAIVLVDDLDQGVAVVDAYGAEHLEIQTADASRVADRITNAGAILLVRILPCLWGTTWQGRTTCCLLGGVQPLRQGWVFTHLFVRCK